MIDTKDIRLGNLVLDKHGKPSRVSEIGKTGIKVEGAPGTYRQYSGEFSPIPISEDWLMSIGITKKNAWYCDKDGEVFLQIDTVISISSWVYSVRNDDTTTEVKYIHQLQNLYYALTGKELKVNIELL